MISHLINAFNVSQIVKLAQVPHHTVQFVPIIKNSYTMDNVIAVVLHKFIMLEIKFVIHVIVLA